MKKWWPNTIVRASYLASSSTSLFEPGGTMIVTNTRATAHTCNAGEDSQQLGRWNYITIRGRNDHYTTIISVYKPSKSQETYMRQISYSAKRRKTLPDGVSTEDLWYMDLSTLITEKMGEGHNIIVAGDFNDDLNNINSRTRKFMDNLGMTEILLDSHEQGPPTHIRGSTTIDGVFATEGISMIQGRYIPFDQSPSDHRWITLDISEESLIGTSRVDRTPPLLRRTTSKIPSIKEAFHNLVEQQVVQHKLHKKISALYELAKTGHAFNENHINTYEAIESTMQRIIKYADKKCRKARRGPLPYSPKQKQLMGAILVLKQVKLRYLLKGKPNRPRMRQLQRLKRKYSFKGTLEFQNANDIQNAINKAINEYNAFKPSAQEHRWTYLETIAREYNDRDGKGIHHHFKVLQHREQIKEYFQRIKISEGKKRGGGVESIAIEENGEVKIVYEKNTIEQEIMRVNAIKLQQANNTPLRSERIAALLGEQGDFEKWEKIIQGTIQLPDDLPDSLKLWYSYITNTEQHSSTDFEWTTAEYFDSWKKISEDKTTLPGIQVAHIKCIDHDSKAADVISLLSLIPFMAGYSLRMWQTGIDSMIPKKTADLRRILGQKNFD